MSESTVPQRVPMQRLATALPRSSADTAGEQRVRQGVAWLLYFGIRGSFGLVWDIPCRASVWRDSFWTPSHIGWRQTRSQRDRAIVHRDSAPPARSHMNGAARRCARAEP
jgi:hypothetical protein